jgi:hypothetical protein
LEVVLIRVVKESLLGDEEVKMAITFGMTVIVLKCLHEFLEDVFVRVALDSLLNDEEVWSASLEQRLKRVITFDPTVGSRLNFYTSFRRPFSLVLLWNRYSMTRRSGRPDLSHSSKEP